MMYLIKDVYLFQTTRVYEIGKTPQYLVDRNANGKTNMALHYNEKRCKMHKHNDNFLYKFFNCLKGSAKYRDMKVRATPISINSVSKIDRSAKVVFPVTFITFNIFYWYSYLHDDGTSKMLL